jgi:uncharacterized membrane protein YvlD (DUF360 family)
MRAVVFALITLVIYKTIESVSWLHSDEAWLVAACVGVLIACWISPILKENHMKCSAIYLLLVLGMYFFAFKVPKFLSGLVDYYLALVVCVVVYTSCYWFFVIRRFKTMA